MRPLTVLILGASLIARVSVAFALAPCPESCHLGQGQPLLLADADALLITRCDRVSDGAASCVTERLDLDGKLLARLPRVPSSVGSDGDFTRAQLAGHTLVGLAWQDPWKILTKPYSLNELFTHQKLTLSLAKSVLTCTAPGQPSVTRDFGCVPSELHVFATMSTAQSKRRPVVVVGLCRPDAHTQHEVVVACAASDNAK